MLDLGMVDVMRTENQVQIVSIKHLVRNKRLLEFAPDAIRIMAGLAIALISATIIFGLPVRLAAISAFLIFYVHDLAFVVMIIPVFFTTLLLFILASATPFWLLGHARRDSTTAIVVSIIVCCIATYLIVGLGSDDSIGFFSNGLQLSFLLLE
jgi:hypothetical protein